MPILEFSYHHLLPPLKRCFTYCALFRKDFIFRKEKIIDLWMAQNYSESVQGKTDKETYEGYFQILEDRFFFQKVENKKFEEGVAFKIHDLMHDMAQKFAKKEISMVNTTTRSIDKSLCHLSDDAPHCCTRGFMVRTKIRTYLVTEYVVELYQFPLISTLLARWRNLRTLDLRCAGFSHLPDTIGQLLHLRYLDLYGNRDLKKLPKSLTKLINLQFLNLDECNELKELPKDLSKLVSLRTLYVPKRLEYMPLGLAGMTHLTRLNWFIVNQRKSCLKLEEYKAMTDLKGSLGIYIRGNYCGKGNYISDTKDLNSINIEWEYVEYDNGRLGNDNDEELLQGLKPHINLKELTICGYPGVIMGGWASEYSLATSLPNLVKIHLKGCHGLEKFPWLGRFEHLKTLILEELKNVEYIVSNSSTVLFFPSLEKLVLREMPKLSRVWEGGLEYLNVLEELELRNLPELKIEVTAKQWRILGQCLRSLQLWNLEKVVNLPMGMRSLTSLQSLYINNLPLKDIPEWIEDLSSLQSLKITGCKHLETLPSVLVKLTSLEEFDLADYSDELKRRCEKPDGEYWSMLEQISHTSALTKEQKKYKYITVMS